MTDGEDDDLYDAYLDACLAGRIENPREFVTRHPGASEALRTKIEALHLLHRAGSAGPGAPAVPADADGLPFERLGEFRLLRRLDEGGMGAVYVARQDSLGRDVALKVLRPELRGSATASERFRREAVAVAKLRHPNIVAVHAVGEDRGVHYLAMEMIPGRTLDEIVAGEAALGRTLPVASVLRWGAQLARALQCAHEAGIVHRDVKPSNVVIRRSETPAPESDGLAMLLDFGVARDENARGPSLTATFAGSPLYAAPEHLSGAPVDARADVYSLGVTLYQALTGRVPFSGDSMEHVLRRVLVESPVPPRRLNPSVPRDADTVVLKALEKDPARRYATAAAFAEDLEAAAHGQPVRARPPGVVRRASGWARRHAVPSAVIATGVVAAVTAAALFASQRHSDAESRRSRAADAVDEARGRLAQYRRTHEDSRRTESEAARLREEMRTRHFREDEERRVQDLEDATAGLRRERETVVYEVLEKLRAADQLDPAGADATDAVRAEIFAEKWHEARDARDPGSAEFYRRLAEQYDRAGRLSDLLRPLVAVTLRTDPPGAEVHLFRYREIAEVQPGGEHRLVPVPLHGEPVIAPGRWALRVVVGAGGVAAGDHVVALSGHPVDDVPLAAADSGEVRRMDRLVEIDAVPVHGMWDAERPALHGAERTYRFERDGTRFDVRAASLAARGIPLLQPEQAASQGGTRATVVHDGVARECVLPPGLVVRLTAAPAIPSPASLAGRTPLEGVRFPEGRYLAVILAPGRETARVAFLLREGEIPPQQDLRLAASGSTEPGFVRVFPANGPAKPFAILDREVTCAEYLAFLNDPAVLASIRGSAEPVLFPRSPDNRHEGGYWPRGDDGRYVLAGDWRPDWPVLGVSFDDAQQYAAWRAARAAEQGRVAKYRLPTLDEWIQAGGAAAGMPYTFGDHFSPRWAKSCFSQSQAGPEPVRSYPVDESPYCVYDLCGSAVEWLDAWYGDGRTARRLGGSSWAQADANLFKTWSALGMAPGASGGETGFRLVLDIPEDAR